jgi:hypothetical protein
MPRDLSDDLLLSPDPDGDHAATPAPANAEEDDSAALLAELDNLLERMMALPVNKLDEEPSVEVRREEAPPPDMPIITVTETIPESFAPIPAPPVSTLDDDLYVQELLHHRHEDPAPLPVPLQHSPPAEPPHAPEPTPPRNTLPVEPLPILTSAPPAEPPVPPPRQAPERPGLWTIPLVWCNRVFDALTRPMGRAGAALRDPRGRSLLGWAGVGLLLLVAGLALSDCLRWTQ